MRTRQLGSSDLHLSVLGLGTWAIGGADWAAGWGPQDDEDSIRTIHAALDAGLNWIDTAAIYGVGHSEAVVGRALASWSGAAPIVATKWGRKDRGDHIEGDLSEAFLIEELDGSLRRLGVECIDLYQLHWPKPPEAIEAAWAAMAKQVAAGKVRYIGVSNCDAEQLRTLQAIHPVTSLQPPYSMIRRDIEAEILPCCRELGIGVVCYSPMAKGLLTGTMTRERIAAMDETDHRRRDRHFQDPRLAVHEELVERLVAVAEEAGYSPAHLAIAWALRDPVVTSAIVGARHPDQIRDTARAGDWEPGEDLLEVVEAYLEEHAEGMAELDG